MPISKQISSKKPKPKPKRETKTKKIVHLDPHGEEIDDPDMIAYLNSQPDRGKLGDGVVDEMFDELFESDSALDFDNIDENGRYKVSPKNPSMYCHKCKGCNIHLVPDTNIGKTFKVECADCKLATAYYSSPVMAQRGWAMMQEADLIFQKRVDELL